MIIKTRSFTDEELVNLIVNKGKSDFFGVLYERYADKVYRKCLSFERDKDAAKDLMHDVLIKVFLQLGNFQQRSRFSTWLYSITYNFCVEHHRKKNKLPFSPIDDEGDFYLEEEVSDEAFLQLQSRELKKALDLISPEDKMILLMKYQDNISIKELMITLNVSESAIKMRLARARKRVKDIMEESLTKSYNE